MKTVIELNEKDITNIVTEYFENKYDKNLVSSMFRIRKEKIGPDNAYVENIIIEMDVVIPGDIKNG